MYVEDHAVTQCNANDSWLCWASVADGGPTLNQRWVNVSCLLGYSLGLLSAADSVTGIQHLHKPRQCPQTELGLLMFKPICLLS